MNTETIHYLTQAELKQLLAKVASKRDKTLICLVLIKESAERAPGSLLYLCMKVLVDTNVFIANMRFAGLKRKLIWRLLEKDAVVVVTDFILEELRENFEEQYSLHPCRLFIKRQRVSWPRDSGASETINFSRE